jgi:hypothetical protein
MEWGFSFWCSDIERRDCFLLVLTPDAVLSSMCDFEIDNAQKQGKRIIPVVARDVDYRSVRKGLRLTSVSNSCPSFWHLAPFFENLQMFHR